jgi:predicted nucleic-acid-binding protein
MLHLVDTNVLIALILESDKWHDTTISFFNENKLTIDIPESANRELRRTFMTKYNEAMRVLIKAVGKARREEINSEIEFIKRVETLTFEIGMKHNPYLKNFYEYILTFSKSNNLLHPKNHILLTRKLDDHLVSLLSKLHNTGGEVVFLSLDDDDLLSSEEIYTYINHLFKDVGDSEIFCEVASLIHRQKEQAVLYTFDKEFVKSGNKALEVLRKNGYSLYIKITYLPDVLSSSK